MFMGVAILNVPLFLATGYPDAQGTATVEDAELRMQFVSIPPGEFVRGLDTGAYREQPAHRVRISRAFELGKYEVTQAQWEFVMGQNPSHFRGADRPVERVSWADAQAFIRRLNER